MASSLALVALILAVLSYIFWLRKHGISGYLFFFSILATPLVALMVGTTVMHITDSNLYAVAAAIVGGPFALAIFIPLVERSKHKQEARANLFLCAYGAAIFVCGLLLLIGITYRGS
jgi:hypothetical protein